MSALIPTMLFWICLYLGAYGVYALARWAWHFFLAALDALSIIDSDKDFKH